MVSTDAATTIQTMDCTTAAVVAWPTAWALQGGLLDTGYAGCWAGLEDSFVP